MNNNAFLTIGFVGVAVTFLLQMIIIIILNQRMENWWIFYLVWFIFLSIGIGTHFANKKKKK
ncbi:MAG: hypothetical protein KJN64_04575 [Ignavibacteria bacterium]|nr:hypothetical protein [Ignavibacteria bacterium]MBT8382137.1 hypothetical protein [Ignavibacteria bacterium]MBT8392658.1 hypothetical protein [Ignavibacteria bacterium]NNJ52279.1 hypothetical protein [Ignavibacteriaceae bacterium]NNL22497.1 hypothetical protein [Ignavibacteriaceae bacterium]